MLLERRDDLPDQLALVVRDADLESRRQLRQDVLGEPALHFLHDAHRVGAFHLHDADAHRGLAVEARQHAIIRQAVLDARHVAEADRRAVAMRHDHCGQRPEVVELEVRLQQVLAGAADQEAARQAHVLAPERVLHVLHGEAEGGHAV